MDSDPVPRFLNATFQHIRNTQGSSDLAFIFFFPAISRHAAPADYLERRDVFQVREDRILDAIGEVAVVFIWGQASRLENRDACFIGGSRAAPRSGLRDVAQVRSWYCDTAG